MNESEDLTGHKAAMLEILRRILPYEEFMRRLSAQSDYIERLVRPLRSRRNADELSRLIDADQRDTPPLEAADD